MRRKKKGVLRDGKTEQASRIASGKGEVGPVTGDESLEGARVEEGVAGLGGDGEG